MGETRVNLEHLLEDIRDSYPFPQEEAIITELIANALDSGASIIKFFIDIEHYTMTVEDNGKGMKEKDLIEYHDIAATTKIRGKGIGFAGVGVKLALLVANIVITETKSVGFHKSTHWRLENPQQAIWEYTDPSGLVTTPSGTAVSIILHSNNSDLINFDFVKYVIQKHFYPLLDQEFMDKILKYIYKNGVHFFINEQKIDLSEQEILGESIPFLVKLGKSKKPIGIGFLRKSSEELAEEERGIAVSTFGKVIKRGWDWLGMMPLNPLNLTGIIEIPQLSEILTTNKSDFLKDGTSYQKYLRYRKAIQESIQPILRHLGELPTPKEKHEKDFRPLEKEIERVLGNILDDFPELSTLFWRKRRTEVIVGVVPDPDSSPIGTIVEGVDVMTGTQGGSGEGLGVEIASGNIPEDRIEISNEKLESGYQHEGRRKRPGLMIGFDDNPNREEFGWLLENTIWVNKAHPAFKRSIDSGAENYHIVLSVAWVLSGYLESEKSPQMFINRFLSGWGKVV